MGFFLSFCPMGSTPERMMPMCLGWGGMGGLAAVGPAGEAVASVIGGAGRRAAAGSEGRGS